MDQSKKAIIVFGLGAALGAYLVAQGLAAFGSAIAYFPLAKLLVSAGLSASYAAYVSFSAFAIELAVLAVWGPRKFPKQASPGVSAPRPQAAPQTDGSVLDRFAVKEKPKPVYTPATTPSPAAPSEGFLDVFPLDPGDSGIFGAISRDDITGKIKYVVIEPTLEKKERILYSQLKALLVDELTVDLPQLKSRKAAEEYLAQSVKKVASRYGYRIPKNQMNKLLYYFKRDFIHLGRLEPLFHDSMIEDISCDGPKVPIYVWHREYESIPTNVIFDSDNELNSFVSKLAYSAGRHVSLANPMVEAALPDGSRIQLSYGREVSQKGSNFTIRRFRPDPMTIVDLIKYNTLDASLASYFWLLIEKRMSLLVGGGTASGKTTSLNAISMFITPGQKIVSCEDTAELNLPHENWIQSVTRTEGSGNEINLFDLLRAALRQRPDIIVVGEVRGKEASTLFQAISTGHGGLGTIHADSVEALITRLTSSPMDIPKATLGSTLDCVVLQLKLRLGNKSVRRVVNVSEVVGFDSRVEQIVMNDAFRWDAASDTFRFSGRSRLFEKLNQRYGLGLDEIRREMENRQAFLNWLVAKGVRGHKDVSQAIRDYYTNPGAAIDKAKLELASRAG